MAAWRSGFDEGKRAHRTTSRASSALGTWHGAKPGPSMPAVVVVQRDARDAGVVAV